jgi:hypothetical protein
MIGGILATVSAVCLCSPTERADMTSTRPAGADRPDTSAAGPYAGDGDLSVPPDGWIPVEHRVLGLDRRTIGPALFVLGLGFVMATILPALNSALSYDDPVEPGDVIGLDGGITFVPTPGWGIVQGRRVSDENASRTFGQRATVEQGDVAFTVETSPVEDGEDAAGLLERIDDTDEKLEGENGFRIIGPTQPVATDAGVDGVEQAFTASGSEGMIAAFVFGDTGVEVVATALPGRFIARQDDVDAMVASISREGSG